MSFEVSNREYKDSALRLSSLEEGECAEIVESSLTGSLVMRTFNGGCGLLAVVLHSCPEVSGTGPGGLLRDTENYGQLKVRRVTVRADIEC